MSCSGLGEKDCDSLGDNGWGDVAAPRNRGPAALADGGSIDRRARAFSDGRIACVGWVAAADRAPPRGRGRNTRCDILARRRSLEGRPRWPLVLVAVECSPFTVGYSARNLSQRWPNT